MATHGKKARAPKALMPAVLYLTQEGTEADPYFVGQDNYEQIDALDGDKVGVYELREVRTLHITRGLR